MCFSKRYLEWDSVFFQKRIVAVSCYANDFLLFPAYLQELKNAKWDLVYLFVDGISEFNVQYDMNLVDIRVVFAFEILRQSQYSRLVSEFIGSPSELYSLSRQAGRYSRFKLDNHFSEMEFNRLYDTWVDNSLNKKYADVVFVYRQDQLIKGFVTGKITRNTIIIGLISVSEDCRGKGIGSVLINHIIAYAYANGCERLEVATQRTNIGACDFYRKCGMHEVSETSVFHFWLNEK